jgi:hypothetical protein
MPKGVYQRSDVIKQAMIARLNTPEVKAKASASRKAKFIRHKGYPLVGLPGRRVALAHRVRAEKALGHALPPGAIVHHADPAASTYASLRTD